METPNQLPQEAHVISWLRKIKLEWELSDEQLSKISHVSAPDLSSFLNLSLCQIADLPAVPAELAPSVPLVNIFKRIQKIYPTAELQNEWLQRPNSVMDGFKPIDAMAMSYEHLAYVSYLVESGLNATQV
jgi:hypothetical protein